MRFWKTFFLKVTFEVLHKKCRIRSSHSGHIRKSEIDDNKCGSNSDEKENQKKIYKSFWIKLPQVLTPSKHFIKSLVEKDQLIKQTQVSSTNILFFTFFKEETKNAVIWIRQNLRVT